MDNPISGQPFIDAIGSPAATFNDAKMTLSEAARVYDAASTNQYNVKSLGSNILRDVGRFASSMAQPGQTGSFLGSGKIDNVFSKGGAGKTDSALSGAWSPDLDRQVQLLNQASNYAGFLSASVSLVSSTVGVVKQLQQG